MITSVTYARLYSLPGYENERFEATASVENDDVALAWEEARICVETQHQQCLMDRQTTKYQPLPQPIAMPIPASDKQRNYIGTLMDELGWSSEKLATLAFDEYRIDLVAMTKNQASNLIEHMRRELDVQRGKLPF